NTRDLPEQGEAPNMQQKKEKQTRMIRYLFMGILFGIVFSKAEIISWFRIQEMFRLQSFFMYGVIGSAVLVALVSVQLIKRYNIKTLAGEEVEIPDKQFKKGQIIGGFIFGLGWALTGACPGPLFAQIGMGFTVIGVTVMRAIAGAWVYGRVAHKLPYQTYRGMAVAIAPIYSFSFGSCCLRMFSATMGSGMT